MAIADDANMALVRRGYAAFNAGDLGTLRELLSHDVAQHVPGQSPLAGAYKGIEAVLSYYAKLAELTDGTMSVELIDLHTDGGAHVMAIHESTATRNGTTRVSSGSILFTLLAGRVVDMMELRGDLDGDDAFFA